MQFLSLEIMMFGQWHMSYILFNRLAQALIRLRLCWSHIPYCWKISYRGSYVNNYRFLNMFIFNTVAMTTESP